MRHEHELGATPNDSASFLAEESRDLSAPLALRAVNFASHQAQIKCHTMQSLLRLISLKTNDGHPNKVTHNFRIGLPVSTASRAWEINPDGPAGRQMENVRTKIGVLLDTACRVEFDASQSKQRTGV